MRGRLSLNGTAVMSVTAPGPANSADSRDTPRLNARIKQSRRSPHSEPVKSHYQSYFWKNLQEQIYLLPDSSHHRIWLFPLMSLLFCNRRLKWFCLKWKAKVLKCIPHPKRWLPGAGGSVPITGAALSQYRHCPTTHSFEPVFTGYLPGIRHALDRGKQGRWGPYSHGTHILLGQDR